jgi:hypothetical protein
MDLISKFTVKPLLITVAVLLVALVAQGITLHIANNNKENAIVTRDAALGQLSDAVASRETYKQSATDWQTTANNIKLKLDAANAENARVAGDNQKAIKNARDRAARLERELASQQSRIQKAKSNPECVNFLEMKICPELRSSSPLP